MRLGLHVGYWGYGFEEAADEVQELYLGTLMCSPMAFDAEGRRRTTRELAELV